jgi:hypothetical protein
MTDSVGIWLPDIQISPDQQKDMKFLPQDGYCLGYMSNMRIKQRTGGVFLSGSIPKYFKGNNVLPLSAEELREALASLEAELGVDLRKGVVRQLETATTLPVKNPPRDYFSAWEVQARVGRDDLPPVSSPVSIGKLPAFSS